MREKEISTSREEQPAIRLNPFTSYDDKRAALAPFKKKKKREKKKNEREKSATLLTSSLL